MSKVCAVTGHRPNRFEFKYNEGHTLCKAIKKAILNEFMQMYDEQEVRHIYVGGALGVDMWAGEAALQLKETPGYSDLQLHVALPFEGHNSKWNQWCKERLGSLIRHSDECITVSNTGSRESYLERNRYMVDRADFLLAVYDDEKNLRSGTMHTVNYARKKNLPVVLIHPDTALISRLPEAKFSGKASRGA